MLATRKASQALTFRLAAERSAVKVASDLGLFAGFDDQAEGKVAEAIGGRLYDYAHNEAVIEVGDRSDSAWMLLAGSVIARAKNGKYVGRWSAPCIFGEEGFLGEDGEILTTVIADGQISTAELTSNFLNKIETGGHGAKFWKNFARAISSRGQQLSRDRDEVTADVVHRQCVILFSDIQGFSQIAAVSDMSETALILARAMTKQSEAIEARGGHVDKLMGDGLMAYWEIGPGMSRKEACRLSLAAAMEALAAVGTIPNPTTDDAGIRIRIGLHVGEAAQGDFGFGRVGGRTLIGDAVNLACRLEQARGGECGSGEIGLIRASEDFVQELDAIDRAELASEAFVQIKGRVFKLMSGPDWSRAR